MQGSFTAESAEKFFQLMQEEGYEVKPPSSSTERVNFSSQAMQVASAWSGNVANFGEVRGEYLDVINYTQCETPEEFAYSEVAEKTEPVGITKEVISVDWGGVAPSEGSILSRYNFSRCERPDGSFYGTAGQCRKGTESSKTSQPKPKDRRQAAKETLKRLAENPPVSVRNLGGGISSISKGSEFKVVLHPENKNALKKLKEEEQYSFEDEQGMWWKAARKGDRIHFAGGDSRHGNKPYKMSIEGSKLD